MSIIIVALICALVVAYVAVVVRKTEPRDEIEPPVPLARPMNYRFRGWTGKDRKYETLPERRQAHLVAKMLLDSTWKGADPIKTPLYIYMPEAIYRMIDSTGKVAVSKGEAGVRGAGMLG